MNPYSMIVHVLFVGHFDLVAYLLKRGARIDMTNSQGKSLVELAAFVGQHMIVRLVNNHIPVSMLEYYTKPQGKVHWRERNRVHVSVVPIILFESH